MFRFARIIEGASKQLQLIVNVVNLNRGHGQRFLEGNMQLVNLNIPSAGFKSHLSIDKVYPNSNPDFLRDSEKPQGTPEQFTGYIPVEELKITTSRSSGPGGQNVNKVNTKVDVRFHLESATWIPESVKSKLAEQEAGRITKDGYFVVRSDATRKQMLNKADCMDKIRTLIFKAATPPKEISAEDLKIKEKRIAKAKAKVLKEKRNRSLLKKSRNAEGMY